MSANALGAAMEGFARGKIWRDDQKKQREIMDLQREDLELRRSEAANRREDSLAYREALGASRQEASAPGGGAPRSISGGGSRASSAPFTGSKADFINMLMPAAIEEGKRIGVDPRIIIAQAAQETGWGRSAPGNNYFGIKSHGKGGGQTLGTHEYVNGKRVNIQDSFRTFASPEDSVRGYADFLMQNKRYKPMLSAQGFDAQVEALGRSGYATDPNYAASIRNIGMNIQIPSAAPAAAPQPAPASPAVAAPVSDRFSQAAPKARSALSFGDEILKKVRG